MNGENNSAAEFNYAIPMLKKGFDMLEIMTHYPEGITDPDLVRHLPGGESLRPYADVLFQIYEEEIR